jgi:hypothetical protein
LRFIHHMIGIWFLNHKYYRLIRLRNSVILYFYFPKKINVESKVWHGNC